MEPIHTIDWPLLKYLYIYVVLCDLPRNIENMVTQVRWLLNTG
jgi:hypothetical protein